MNTTSSPRTPRIAIVCRDDRAGEAVTSFVAQLGLEPVITQQPRPGAGDGPSAPQSKPGWSPVAEP